MADEWIRCEDRKPPTHVDVLIYHVLGDRDRVEVPHAFDVAYWTGKEWEFPWDREQKNCPPQFVTHWQPLEAP